MNTLPCSSDAKPIVLEIKGLGHVPGNFKNRKRAIIDRRTGKMRTLTDPKVKKWMERAARSIESQLLLRYQTFAKETVMEQRLLSWIQSYLPLSDSLTWIELGYVRGRRVKKGEEGATIVLERLQGGIPN